MPIGDQVRDRRTHNISPIALRTCAGQPRSEELRDSFCNTILPQGEAENSIMTNLQYPLIKAILPSRYTLFYL